MFDGSFKSSRKVNLSGRRKPFTATSSGTTAFPSKNHHSLPSSSAANSKEELLQQTKFAREERLVLKKRTVASTRIQGFVRRVLTTCRIRTQVFTALEQQLAQIVTTVDVKSVPLPTQEITVLLRQFLFAYGQNAVQLTTKSDCWNGMNGVSVQRIRNAQDYLICILLVSCLKGTQETNFLAANKDATWVYQMRGILEISLQTVLKTEFASPIEQAMNPYLLVVDFFTSASKYPPSPENQTACTALLHQLAVNARFSTFDALSVCIRRHTAISGRNQINEDRVVQVICRITSETLGFASVAVGEVVGIRNRILQRFAMKVLLTSCAASSPVLQYVMAMRSAITTHSNQSEAHFWVSVVQLLLDEENRASTFKWHERAIAVGNLVDLVVIHGFDASLVHIASTMIAQLVSKSLLQWAFEAGNGDEDVITIEDHDMEAHDEERTRHVSQILQSLTRNLDDDDEKRSGIVLLGDAEQRIRLQWQQLCNSNFGRRCFDTILASEVQSSSMVSSHASDAANSLCAIYAAVFLALAGSYVFKVNTTFAPPPPPIFSFLSAMTVEQLDVGQQSNSVFTTIKSIWRWIQSQMNAPKAAANSSKSVYKHSQLTALLVFNVIYSHTLLGLDDDSFYDRRWPLEGREVEAVVALLKRFIYDTCWNISSNTSTSSDSISAEQSLRFAAVTTSVKLFNQLYDRDCRRRFTADGAWLWPSMPLIKETVDLESMQEEGSHGTQALYLLMTGGAVSSRYTPDALILTTIPQVFAFHDRVKLFEKLLEQDKMQLAHVRDEFNRALQVRIKRDEIVDDSLEFFQKVCDTMSPSALKSRIKVTFINEQGLEEAGIDGGGVFKEYVDSLTKSAFSPEYGFFLPTDEQLLYPNPAARLIVESDKELLDRYRFLGRVLAKAVYENILVEPQFAAFFLNKLLGKFNYIDDLHSLDPELYRSLMQLKHYQGNVEDLALTFSVSEMEFGQTVTRNLMPDGANIPVTNSNRIRYMHVMANYKLNILSSRESAAFLKGFRDLIPTTWIQMFSPAELQMLIGGSANKIDIDDWQKHTLYGGGYHPSQLVIQWFWDILANDFTMEDRAALLKFITSCSRQPLLGFGQLAPQICIHQVRIDDDERLPSSATCMNLLKLPTYSSKEIMRKKLLYAIKANAGFDLS